MHEFTLAQGAGVAGAAIGFVCCVLIVGLAIGVLVGAIILRAAVKWVLKYDIAFGEACKITLIAGGINMVVSIVLGMLFAVVAGSGDERAAQTARGLSSIVSLPIGFLISSAIYGAMLKFPETDMPVGFGKGALVTLVSYAIGLAIGIVIAVIVIGLIFATGTRF